MDFSCKLIAYEQLFECDRRLKMAEYQIERLHTRRAEIFQRYLAAYNNRNRNFRAVCRGRLLIVEGVLTAYKMYIQQKKRQVVIIFHIKSSAWSPFPRKCMLVCVKPS